MPPKGVYTLSASSDFREKAIKVLQYLAKLLHACGVGGKQTKEVAKFLSSGRDVMTLMRWVKYTSDFEDARGTVEQPLRALMFTEATLNVTVDCMNDLNVLGKLGIVGPLPALSPRWSFARLTNLLDSILAAVGTAVTILQLRAATTESALAKQRLALVSYIGSVLKNTHATQLSLGPFHGDRTAALGGFLSAAISANKLINKHCIQNARSDGEQLLGAAAGPGEAGIKLPVEVRSGGVKAS